MNFACLEIIIPLALSLFIESSSLTQLPTWESVDGKIVAAEIVGASGKGEKFVFTFRQGDKRFKVKASRLSPASRQAAVQFLEEKADRKKQQRLARIRESTKEREQKTKEYEERRRRMGPVVCVKLTTARTVYSLGVTSSGATGANVAAQAQVNAASIDDGIRYPHLTFANLTNKEIKSILVRVEQFQSSKPNLVPIRNSTSFVTKRIPATKMRDLKRSRFN